MPCHHLAEEREAVRAALIHYPDTGADAANVLRLRATLEPKIPAYDIAGARNFHLVCDLLTVAFLWAKEWRRRKPEGLPAAAS